MKKKKKVEFGFVSVGITLLANSLRRVVYRLAVFLLLEDAEVLAEILQSMQQHSAFAQLMS